MLPFVVLGGATTLYILWALTAFPLQLYVQENSLVYINQSTNNTAVAFLYLIVTCGALFFSEIRMMVVFGAANLAILLIVMTVKRYAFTSVWCGYATAASVIILAWAVVGIAIVNAPSAQKSIANLGSQSDVIRDLFTS